MDDGLGRARRRPRARHRAVGQRVAARPPGTPISRDGLWQLRFEDVSKPSAGMTLEPLLDGTEAPYLNKPDNMDINEEGHLLIQEDPGNNAHLARPKPNYGSG